jgi:hypothetical protein
VPLARLVFVAEKDGRLHRSTIGTIGEGNGMTGGGIEAEREHEHISIDGAARETAA